MTRIYIPPYTCISIHTNKTRKVMKTTEINLTDLEKKVMVNIAKSEYIDVLTLDQLVDYPTWSFVATNETKQLTGALGSLAKKGMVECSSDPENAQNRGDDHTCWLTKQGVEILKTFYSI